MVPSGADVLKPYKDKVWLDEQINVLGKTQSQVAKECGVSRHSIRRVRFSESIREYGKEYRNKNKEILARNQKQKRLDLKIEILNKIGRGKCAICGDKNLAHLTIDHINGNGSLERKKYGKGFNFYFAIKKGRVKNLDNLRVLCWNHNDETMKKYLDVPYEKQTDQQRNHTKLWHEAYNFFGPCHCGVSELKFLTLSHIHNDGAKRKRNGEGHSFEVFRTFRFLGWPESLKEDHCLECFNCNCSRGNREE